jgi:hypothetical protein
VNAVEYVLNVQEKKELLNIPKKLKRENALFARVLENVQGVMARGKYMELNVPFVTVIDLVKNVLALVH